jgi:hypothetical protein
MVWVNSETVVHGRHQAATPSVLMFQGLVKPVQFLEFEQFVQTLPRVRGHLSR